MGDAKDQFLKDEELAGAWSAFVNGPHSGKLFAFADGELINQYDLTPEKIRGAQIYKGILQSICEPDAKPSSYPGSGLHHDIDPKPRTPKKPEPKK